MPSEFPMFDHAPLPGAITRPEEGQRQYLLPLALDVMSDAPDVVDDLKDTLTHLEAHTAFLRVQLWVHALLRVWEEQAPELERFGVATNQDDSFEFSDPRNLSSWVGWFSQGHWSLGVRPNGEPLMVSMLDALQKGVSEEGMQPLKALFVRQCLSVPKDPASSFLMERLLTSGVSEEQAKAGWTRDEWKQRLERLGLFPSVFSEVKSVLVDAGLPPPRPKRGPGVRF